MENEVALDTEHSARLAQWAERQDKTLRLYRREKSETLHVSDLGGGRIKLAAPVRLTGWTDALAALEALSSQAQEEQLIVLNRQAWQSLAPDLLDRGVARILDDVYLAVFPETLWQLPDLWLGHPPHSFPLSCVPGPNGPHPLRPRKPQGVLYRRYIPWLGQTFSLRALDREADLDLFHEWMNDDRIAAFFDEAGSLDDHRAYLSNMEADPHMMPVLGCLEDTPFSYFELYWAKENRLGAQYEAGAWDRGWHVLVGDSTMRGADYVTAWLPSLMHYMFLAEPRLEAIVGEPAASHTQQLRNLTRNGFARVKEFDFAHKRATLIRLERDYFFKARLWARPAPRDPAAPLRLSLVSHLTQGALQ